MSVVYEKPEDKDWNGPDPEPRPVTRCRFAFELIKIGLLLVLWSFFTVVLIVAPANHLETSVVTVLPNETVVRWLPTAVSKITLQGAIDARLVKFPKDTADVPRVSVRLEWRNTATKEISHHTAMWSVYLQDNPYEFVKVSKLFQLPEAGLSGDQVVVTLRGDCEYPVALLMVTDSHPIVTDYGHVYGAILLLGLYVLIVFELTDPTFGALLISTTGIAVLSLFGDRPAIYDIVTWIDFDTLMLMIGMMIIVGIMSDTGIFDWLVIQTYRLSQGHPWPVVFLLGVLTAAMSSVLGNVMIVFLIVPIVVRLCEAINLQTSLVLLVVTMYSNLGGALTPVGVPPNMIIATNVEVQFVDFTLHMLPGVLGSLLVGMPVVYLTMREKLYRLEGPQMMGLSVREETLGRFTRRSPWIRKREQSGSCIRPAYDYHETLAYLQAHYGILNKPLLAMSMITAAFVLVSFAIHSMSFMPGASFGWVAILGALLLVTLAKLDDFDLVLRQVDWSILLFLIAHFVLIGVVDELGLIRWLDDQAVKVIASVERRHQTTVAILLILWTSGFISAFVGNVPVTSLGLKVIISLAQNETISVPQSPLIWALSYGACFGANGSLFGANAIMIGAALARQFGYRITSRQFFLHGFPMMLATLLVASVYLLVAHTALGLI